MNQPLHALEMRIDPECGYRAVSYQQLLDRKHANTEPQVWAYWQQLHPALGLHGAAVAPLAATASVLEDTASTLPARPTGVPHPELEDEELRRQALQCALAWNGYYRMTLKDRHEDWTESPRKRDPALFDAELTEIMADEALHELVRLREAGPAQAPPRWWAQVPDAAAAVLDPEGHPLDERDFVNYRWEYMDELETLDREKRTTTRAPWMHLLGLIEDSYYLPLRQREPLAAPVPGEAGSNEDVDSVGMATAHLGDELAPRPRCRYRQAHQGAG